MAYAANEILVTVRGAASPSETWNNTWAFTPDGGAPDRQAVVDALHDFYDGLAVSHWPTEVTAVGAQIRDLFNSVTTDADWATITGSEVEDILPTQLAVRVSLTDSLGHHGGPFIAGWSEATNAEDGLVDNGAITYLTTALGSLRDAAIAADYRIGLHRPTVETVELATFGRVGKRFDVIRKRGNDTAETYVVVDLTP